MERTLGALQLRCTCTPYKLKKGDIAVRAALARFMRGAWFGGFGTVVVYAACGKGREAEEENEEEEEDEDEEESEEAETRRDMTGQDLKNHRTRHRGKFNVRNP